ncbi:MAG: 2-amino-4-hydroxy-6-hydroxymethyldihydropteridine diphosphokinase [Burkholderiales bacterium]|nr:2-amino-4-hydroxy-6-hydroxymethyldihydropteridine diphosphokinase [Burkholderiales bacterium]
MSAYVGLGANLGDARVALAAAVQALAALPATRLAAVSSLYASAPVDAGGPDYFNAVACLQTTLAPLALLRALQAIETAAGRTRPYRNAPRTLDLDLLLYDAVQCADAELTLPHPRMMQRAFVVLPLAELAPERVSAAQRAAVAGQRIERVAPAPDWYSSKR